MNPAAPAPTLLGERELIAGPGLTLKLDAADVPPSGLTTLIGMVPAEATSPAAMAAVSCELLTKFVVRLLPFHCTVAPETKLLPFTVSVNADAPAPTLLGERELIAGPAFTVNVEPVEAVELPLSGLTTLTVTAPAEATSPAEMAAVSCELLTKVVVRGLPFHCTVAPETKLLPFTVNVNAGAPAPALLGERELIDGPALTVKVKGAETADVPPLGAGSVTVTLIVPGDVTRLAVTVATICVLVREVTVRLVVPNCTVAPGDPVTKLLPAIVNGKSAEPAPTALGDNAVIVGL